MPLYIISTPIGNLKDITFRAIETLHNSDIILAEDTRRTSILLNHYTIKGKQMTSFNDNNKAYKSPQIIQELLNGKNISIVSDSGTPGISDPGFYLVREAVKNNIKTIPIPGPTASITALISSGFPTDSFIFYGFISKKEKAKADLLNEINRSKKTAIIYESPYRLIKTLKLISEIMPEKKLCIARELTKKFEEFIRGTSKELYAQLKDKAIKGEITIIINK
ncbi:MAG: 16S rRNA (cytidine(1402)-2'-O)-methyltransferase [Nanoarchaeota archaeon]|nr:16S rRNA (cytidine(1402)-2'-O)-methyltransferase [Nanoarchaeota archaeon]MBU1005308.1 16S rRNA (cytidine(1402)-2'-O)-methyltransferase [Nanoarchaeota archaeon]MBU1946936.1 16S rRNA (cytidine(1402)-2'-O)-methyltransferase [Nanoarchaeota archaeon]